MFFKFQTTSGKDVLVNMDKVRNVCRLRDFIKETDKPDASILYYDTGGGEEVVDSLERIAERISTKAQWLLADVSSLTS
jgi:hypothetical protein